MSDPVRLLSGVSDANDAERALLSSIRSVDPPQGARDEAWAMLAGQMAAISLVGASTAAGAEALGAKGGLAWGSKALLLKLGALFVVGSAGAGAYWVHSQPAQHAVAAPTVSSRAALSPTTVAAPLASAEPVTESVLEPSPKAAAALAPSREPVKRPDALAEESSLLADARAALRRGDTNTAEVGLRRLRTRFPTGALRQERQVLSIELLNARGEILQAQAEARRFLAAYPTSPHGEKLRRFLGER